MSLQRSRLGWTPKFTTAKFCLKKLETLPYRMVYSVVEYRELFRRDSRVLGHADRQTLREKVARFATLRGQNCSAKKLLPY